MPSEEKMTPEQFCYWLQGAMEVTNPSGLTAEQVQVIKDHLALVFNKVTPDRNDNDLKNIFKELDSPREMPWASPYEVTCKTDTYC